MHDNILGLTSGNTICVTCNMFGDDLQNTAFVTCKWICMKGVLVR